MHFLYADNPIWGKQKQESTKKLVLAKMGGAGSFRKKNIQQDRETKDPVKGMEEEDEEEVVVDEGGGGRGRIKETEEEVCQFMYGSMHTYIHLCLCVCTHTPT